MELHHSVELMRLAASLEAKPAKLVGRPGLEPGISWFRARDVTYYTIGQKLVGEVGFEPTLSSFKARWPTVSRLSRKGSLCSGSLPPGEVVHQRGLEPRLRG